MRFFISVIIVLGLSGFAAAQTPSDSPAFERLLFAGQLGEISALALGEDGSVYAAEINRGVIYKFTDRGKDGKLDSRQVIASNFDKPSGLAVRDGRIFVSDARAIWDVNPRGGDVRHVASLLNSQALTAPRPLFVSKENGELLIGLTDRVGAGSKLISVDVETGKARSMSAGRGAMDVLAGGKNIWTASGGAIFPIYGDHAAGEQGTVVIAGAHVSGLVLPRAESLSPLSQAFPDHIFTSVRIKKGAASFSHSDVMRVYALPTAFGNPSGASPVSVISDIQASRNRTGGMFSGAMVMDERGIFIADSGAGVVWRIVPSKPKLRPRQPVKEPSEDALAALPKTELNPKGSGLSSASTLTEGTTLKVGSTIPEEDEKEKSGPQSEPPLQIKPSSPETGEEN